VNVFPCFTIFAGAFDARPSQPPGRASHAPAKMVQPGKPFTRRVNLKVDKLYYGISIGGIMTYNALRIVSTGIIYRLSNGREWVELAENARFFSMKDQEEF